MSQPMSIRELDQKLVEAVEGLTHLQQRLGEFFDGLESTIPGEMRLPRVVSLLNTEVGRVCDETRKCVTLRADLDRFNDELKNRELVLNRRLRESSYIQSCIGKLDEHTVKLDGIETINTRLDGQQTSLDRIQGKLDESLDGFNKRLDNTSGGGGVEMVNPQQDILSNMQAEITRLVAVESNQRLIMNKLNDIEAKVESPGRGNGPVTRSVGVGTEPASSSSRSLRPATKRKRTSDDSSIESEPVGSEAADDEEMTGQLKEWRSVLKVVQAAADLTVVEGENCGLTPIMIRRILISCLGYQTLSPEWLERFLNDDENIGEWVCVATLCNFNETYQPDDDRCEDCSDVDAKRCLQVRKDRPGKAAFRVTDWD